VSLIERRRAQARSAQRRRGPRVRRRSGRGKRSSDSTSSSAEAPFTWRSPASTASRAPLAHREISKHHLGSTPSASTGSAVESGAHGRVSHLRSRLSGRLARLHFHESLSPLRPVSDGVGNEVHNRSSCRVSGLPESTTSFTARGLLPGGPCWAERIRVASLLTALSVGRELVRATLDRGRR